MSGMVLPLLAAVPELGGYLSVVKPVVMLALVLGWLCASAWVDRDTEQIRASKMVWTSLMVGVGLAALIVWLLLPIYVVGLSIFVVSVMVTGLIYVAHHNSKVIPDAKVLTGEHLSQLFSRKERPGANVVVKLKVYGKNSTPITPPNSGTVEEKLTFNTSQELLYDMVWRRASEVDLMPNSQATAVRYVIDGVVVPQEHMERAESENVIQYLKGVAGMDVEDRRRPQTGRITVDLANHPVEINLISTGSTAGQRMQFKVVQEAVRSRIGELGLSEELLARLRSLNAVPQGLMIVAARPKTGLTSTLYSLLRDNDAYIKQLASVEREPDVDLENITQNRYKSQEDQSRVLAGVLRRDPDVVMVDNCEDSATAEVVLDGADEKKILLGQHAPDSFTALARWAKTVGDARRAVAPLQAVLCQVLVRKLCPNCKEAYRPDPELVRKANLPAAKAEKFYRPPTEPLTDEKGRPYTCPTCQGSGYFQRTAAFELLEVTDEMRKLIAQGAGLSQIKAAARKNRMVYLQEAALRLVMEGVTSVQEVIRVTKSKQEQR